MFLLISPTDLLELVTAATCNISVTTHFVDNFQTTASPVIAPGRLNTPSITTATTTTIVGSPPASATASSWSITTNVLTVSTVTNGQFAPGAPISGTGVGAGIYILQQLTGTSGGAGTYLISASSTTGGSGTLSQSAQRNVQTVLIHNVSITVTSALTVLHTDGTNVVTAYGITLQPGETAQFVWGSGWKTFDINGVEKVTTVSPAMQTVTFGSGTTFTVTAWNTHVRVTSTTVGAKTVTGPAATGSGGLIEITDAGALAANPTNNITFASASSINGPVILSVTTQTLGMRDVASGQIDSV